MGGCTKPSRNSGADRTMQRRMGNLTFEQYCESHPDFKTTGEGCRITPAWKTKSTQADIRLKIEEFWDTRTSGDPMMWRTLRSACEAPDASMD
jgi:hypothetical protein